MFNNKNPIRVVLVDDSPLALQMLKRSLSLYDDIDIVATARDGIDALEVIAQTRPDVLCTDLHMPRMDGLELIRQVMARMPLPIVAVSVSVTPDKTHNIFALLEAGAIDVFEKPRGGLDTEYLDNYEALAHKIRIASGVSVFRRNIKGSVESRTPIDIPQRKTGKTAIIVIGASTGGPIALKALLARLPADYPLPIVCVQHIGAGFLDGLIRWLDDITIMNVVEAGDGDVPQPGSIYIAGSNRHLGFDAKGRFQYFDADPMGGGHRPSVDALLQSAAARFGNTACGILLTGMGYDGARGMAAIHTAGGCTIAQDSDSCVVFGMPKAAISVHAVDQVLSITDIAETVRTMGIQGSQR